MKDLTHDIVRLAASQNNGGMPVVTLHSNIHMKPLLKAYVPSWLASTVWRAIDFVTTNASTGIWLW
jgi:hypothetical protein